MKIILPIVFFSCLSAVQAQMSMKLLTSPDTSYIARIITVKTADGTDQESAVEVRSRAGSPVARKSFISRDHQHGFGIIRTVWTSDSRYLVISTMGSGGNYAGRFPTWFLPVREKRFLPLDTLAGVTALDPEFMIEYPDTLIINSMTLAGAKRMPDTLVRSISLDSLLRQWEKQRR